MEKEGEENKKVGEEQTKLPLTIGIKETEIVKNVIFKSPATVD